MAAYRLFTMFTNRTVTTCFKQSFLPKQKFMKPVQSVIIPSCGMRPAWSKFERIMKTRRKLAGPERLRRRNEWIDWDYKAELFAFPIRLHENISEETLRIAFTHQSYIDAEEKRRSELGSQVQDVPLNLVPNTSLAVDGGKIMHSYIKGFIRHCYKKLPEEGVSAVHAFLTSEDVLAHVSSNIGTSDLILSADFPVENSTLATTLKAVIGAIAKDQTEERAELFVLDFICTQLVGQDVMEIWDIPNPLQVVDELLKRHGRAPCESRLVFESGRNTLEAIYVVGLYSDRKFLGQGPGETVAAAEEIAAIDVLRKLFDTTLAEKPLPFGRQGRNLKFDKETPNASLSEWYNEKFEDKRLSASSEKLQ